MHLKNKPKWLLLLFIVPVFAGIVVFRCTHTPSVTRAKSNNITQDTITSGTNQIEAEFLSQAEAAKSNKMNGDGFQQPESDFSEDVLRIEAIFISASGKSSIFVNGQYACEGDTINELEIIKIYPDKVEFNKNGNIITAYLPAP